MVTETCADEDDDCVVVTAVEATTLKSVFAEFTFVVESCAQIVHVVIAADVGNPKLIVRLPKLSAIGAAIMFAGAPAPC